MPVIEIPRKKFDPSDPWSPPAGAATVPLVDARTGLPPLLATTLSLWRDETNLYALFACEVREVVATYTERDQPLWEEDVVELFLGPEGCESYFELEVSPLGTIFDAKVFSPDGHRSTMQVDKTWNCDGLTAAVRVEPGRCLEILAIVPFAGLGRSAPLEGERWKANFYRIDRSASGDEYTAWRPTMKTPPDFHVPSAFGDITFEG